MASAFFVAGTAGKAQAEISGLRSLNTRLKAMVLRQRAAEAERQAQQGERSYALALVKGRLVKLWTPRALVSLHALGRHLERTGLRDHDRLLADLAVLADDAGDEGGKVPTPDGGCWLGPMQKVGGSDGVSARARTVRTWVDG